MNKTKSLKAFMRGCGSVIRLFPTHGNNRLKPASKGMAGCKADRFALQKDWSAVGDDLWFALGHFVAKETRQHGEL